MQTFEQRKTEREAIARKKRETAIANIETAVGQYINKVINDADLWDALTSASATKSNLLIYAFRDAKARRVPNEQ